MYISWPQDGAKHLLSAINNLSHTFPKWEDNLTTSFLFAATDLLFYHERITIKHHLAQSDLTFKNHKAAASTFTPLCCVNLSRVCIWLSLICLKDDWRGQVSLFTVENVQQQVSKQPLKPRKKVTLKYSHFFSHSTRMFLLSYFWLLYFIFFTLQHCHNSINNNNAWKNRLIKIPHILIWTTDLHH